MLLIELKVNSAFGSGEAKKEFSDRKNIAIFDLQVIPMLPTTFQVNWTFGSGVEAKNRFSRWPPWRPSWIFDRND